MSKKIDLMIVFSKIDSQGLRSLLFLSIFYIGLIYFYIIGGHNIVDFFVILTTLLFFIYLTPSIKINSYNKKLKKFNKENNTFLPVLREGKTHFIKSHLFVFIMTSICFNYFLFLNPLYFSVDNVETLTPVLSQTSKALIENNGFTMLNKITSNYEMIQEPLNWAIFFFLITHITIQIIINIIRHRNIDNRFKELLGLNLNQL